jgi:hypothetical protein
MIAIPPERIGQRTWKGDKSDEGREIAAAPCSILGGSPERTMKMCAVISRISAYNDERIPPQSEVDQHRSATLQRFARAA